MKILYGIILLIVIFIVYFFVYGKKVDNTKFTNIEISEKSEEFKIQFIRHATAILYIDGKKFLIDPMLGNVASQGAYPLTANRVKNPSIGLPVKIEDITKDLDGIILTHTHPDHFDKKAEEVLDKDLSFYIQNEDKESLEKKGFTNLNIVNNSFNIGGIKITSFDVNHGEGFWEKPMGAVKAYLIEKGDKNILISGDTIYDDNFTSILNKTKPENVLLFTGNAQFIFGNPITLDLNDIEKISKLLPEAKIIPVHMEAINHCNLRREDVNNHFKDNNLVTAPNEGENILLK